MTQSSEKKQSTISSASSGIEHPSSSSKPDSYHGIKIARYDPDALIDNERSVDDLPWVGGSFADRESGERAYRLLLDRGYSVNEINLLMTSETRQRLFDDGDQETKLSEKAQETIAERALEGSLKGALVGTILTFTSNFILPGVGLLFGGPLFVGLGALTGGFAKALSESGIPENQVPAYEAALKSGKIIMGVKPHTVEDIEYFDREWNQGF